MSNGASDADAVHARPTVSGVRADELDGELDGELDDGLLGSGLGGGREATLASVRASPNTFPKTPRARPMTRAAGVRWCSRTLRSSSLRDSASGR